MRPRISIRGYVRPSVRLSVCPSVRPSVRNAFFSNSRKWLKYYQNWIKTKPKQLRHPGLRVCPSVGLSVRPSFRPSVTHSLSSPKFDNSPISTDRKWIKVLNDVHVHPINRHSDDHDHHNYRNDHNETTKKRRRIFVRLPNLFWKLFLQSLFMSTKPFGTM